MTKNHEPQQDAPDAQSDGHSDESQAKAESRRVWIMRGLITPILGMLAVTCIALGLLNATVWKPSREITADASVSGVQYIATDPGVLPLVDRQSTLTVSSTASDEICVALGGGKDINGWVAGSAYTRVTGLSDWHTLAVERSDAKGDAKGDGQSAVAFKDSDMWTQVECGKGKVTLKTDVESGAATMALVDLGKAGTAEVSLHWVRQTLPDFALPFYFAGGLLAGMAVLTASLFAMPPHKRRKRMVASAAAEEVGIGEALAGSWAAIRPRSSSKSRHSRHRHSARREDDHNGNETAETTGSQPIVVDPSVRNLVADQQSAAETVTRMAGGAATLAAEPEAEPHDETHDDASVDTAANDDDGGVDEAATSVITQEELMAYFARLAQETSDDGKDDKEADQ